MFVGDRGLHNKEPMTNDKQLRQFKEIKCITVDELE